MTFPLLTSLHAPTLEGLLVRLEPLDRRHGDDLAVACEEDRNSYRYTRVPTAAEVDGYIDGQLERAATGRAASYAIVERASDRAVGHTSFLDPRPWPDGAGVSAVEIGSSWLAASAQGTGINSEAKLLLLDHAFSDLGVARVDLMTDARNERSRAAIAAVGATFEGVLRRVGHSRVAGEDGMLRDTAVFSVVREEWPEARARLVARVASRLGRRR